MKKQTRQNKNKHGLETSDTKYQLSLKDKLRFSLKNLFFIFFLGLALGGFIGYEVARTYVDVTEGGGIRDAYGRGVGHPHYAHNHR